jgi:membrane protease YdiL (CAAX protease family)
VYALNFQNPWIAGVDTSRRRIPAWAGLAVATAIAVAAVLAGVAAAAPLGRVTHGVLATFVVLNLVVFGVMWAAAWGVGAFEGRRIWPAGAKAPLAAAAGLAAGAAGLGVAVAMSVAAGGAVLAGRGAAAAGSGIAIGFLVIAFQASAEEALFRGWLQPLLGARWGPWLGLAATSLLFAALHLVGAGRSVLTLVNLLLAGLLFGLMALRTGGLWAPAAAHAGWNWMEASVLGLVPNPGVGPTGSLFDFDCVGTGVWSGGADAMNGAITTTAALLALTVALAAWPTRKSVAVSDSARPAERRSDRAP